MNMDTTQTKILFSTPRVISYSIISLFNGCTWQDIWWIQPNQGILFSTHVSFPRVSFFCLTVVHEKTHEYGYNSNKESYCQHHVSFLRVSFLCLTVAHDKTYDGYNRTKEFYSQHTCHSLEYHFLFNGCTWEDTWIWIQLKQRILLSTPRVIP